MWKSTHHHSWEGKSKSNNNRSSHASENGMHQKVCKETVRNNTYPLLAGILSGYPLWKAMWISRPKIRNRNPIWPIIPFLSIYPQNTKTIIWKLCSLQDWYNSLDRETTQMPIYRWMVNKCHIYLRKKKSSDLPQLRWTRGFRTNWCQ